jgi:hypothetical protein
MISTCSISPALPTDVIDNSIFRNLSLPVLGICSLVCKIWRERAEKQINTFSHEKAFGPKEWFIHFGAHLKNVPRLPTNIAEFLFSSCPFWLDKKVHETHLLVLVPETINGQPLNLKTLGELVKKPLTVFATQYDYFCIGEHADLAAPPSHWVLMTRDVIEESRNKTYLDQQTLLRQKGQGVYVVPTILDATVCVFMEYVRSGIRLYSDSPYTFTQCQEKYDANWQLGVGGFDPVGLDIDNYYGDHEDIGVAGSRKF